MRPKGYTRGWMSPEQEQQVCDALVNLGMLETEQGLHAEGVRRSKASCTARWMTRERHSMICADAGRSRRRRCRPTSWPILVLCRSRSSVGSDPARPNNPRVAW